MTETSTAQIRLTNLKNYLALTKWSVEALAVQCGRSQQQLDGWLSEYRAIGTGQARELEARLGLADGALDRPARPEEPFSQLGMTRVPVCEDATASHASADAWYVFVWFLRDAPEVLLRVNRNETRIPSSAQQYTQCPCSPYAAFFVVPNDSMGPDLRRGDHVLVDPEVAAEGGDLVLLAVASGECLLRRFVQRARGDFVAVAPAHSSTALSSRDDGAQVLGVVLEHRAYRAHRVTTTV